ncbi:MAG: galR [Frankiales bacterium]|nr:galR [Frankiales bacterium]
MTVTSADVARAAGVSRATVSYVLNDAPGRVLTPETRETVLRVARELGYQPSALARSLKRGRSNTVLFPLQGGELNHVLATLFTACTEALTPRGLSLVLDTSQHTDPGAQADVWAGLAPAAVLDLVLHHDDAALLRLRSRGVPVLSTASVGAHAWESSGDVFAREQRLMQIRHLAARGYRRVLSVFPHALPASVDPRTASLLRSGMRTVAEEAGSLLEIVELDLDEIPAAVAGWDLPDAVAAYNDTYAIAIMTALHARGVQVPTDVAVMGADDEPLGRAVTPALTTVAGDFTAFAHAVADAVEAVLAGRTPAPLPVPGLVLVERASA